MERVNFELGKTIVLPLLKQQLFESHNWQAGLHEAGGCKWPQVFINWAISMPRGRVVGGEVCLQRHKKFKNHTHI